MKEFSKIIKEMRRRKFKKVFLQFPEGIKLKIQEISKKLEENGLEVIICLEETFGACDLKDEEAKRLGCDSILHIGHTDFGIKSKLPVIYWEYKFEVDPISILRKNFNSLKGFEKIGLVTSVQFVEAIPKIKSFLESKGKKVLVYKALKYPGQILGCNLAALKKIEKNVDCFVCISAGKFYALGAAFSSEKPILVLDLEKQGVYEISGDVKKIKKIIAWNKSKFKEARKVGILISWKKGQVRKDIFDIKRKLEDIGKEVFLLAMDEISPKKLEGLKLDFLINCACPRIGLDDLARYKIPILNLEELLKNKNLYLKE